MKRDDSGGAVWEVVVAILMVLVAAVAFADGHKRVIHGKPADRHAIEMLLDESDGDAEVAAGDTISELKGRFKLDRNKPVEEAAVDFIDRHRNAFGLKNPKEELKLRDAMPSDDMSFQQTYNGVPIWRQSIGMHLNKDKEIYLVVGNHVPTPDIDTNPLMTKEEAVEIARADRIAKDGGNIVDPRSELWIYKNNLAYGIGFLYRGHGWRYFIDAKNGRILYKCDVTEVD